MPRREHTLSKYNAVWLIAMFDLPVKTKRDRKVYSQFRKKLIATGFSMMQYSVYFRFCASEELATKHRNTVRSALPTVGHVRIVTVTDRQFEKMENYVGRLRNKNEMPTEQLIFF